MKRIFTFLAVVAIAAMAIFGSSMMTSCNTNTGPVPPPVDTTNKILDPMAKISIRANTAAMSAQTRAGDYLSPLEIVKRAGDIVLQSPNYPNEPYVNFGISDETRDTVNLRIMMWGIWVIENGKISRDFVEAWDVIFVTRKDDNPSYDIADTVAYIPNAQLREAEVKIKAAYADSNFTEVYRLFDEAYKFTPINGEDWLKLKAEGRN